ncbi:olfactory receptor 2K2-like isoform X1 [Amphiprion ocellaris]|uniref:olfactory receptor 2K2-like isoform X1 n=2 Tax=Amphiprion ocellaris TaxID=80972 RepID=UPI00241141F8|nr:olfactory receptor 2K2-like isoform X1 [Amphiprion ocellaris]
MFLSCAELLWMENLTVAVPLQHPVVFELEGFFVPPGYDSLLFVLALLSYVAVLLGNGLVVSIIVLDKNLHRPMFVMVCNLVLCDLLGATAVLPRLMVHFLTGQKRIAYYPAIAQAFSVHTYGVAAQTILGAMAYDRYIAVCEPLRYHAIMTSARLHCCCALAWLVALLLIAVLFAFHANVPLCGRTIRHVYCSNRSILSLACTPTTVNNIYGLSMTWTVSTGIFLIIAFSYIRILQASLKQGQTDSNVRSKVFQTCGSHLVIYLLYEIASVIIILSYRFPSVSPNLKKFFSIMFFIVPPIINPIIYGLVSKELRSSIVKHLTISWQRL